jgi:hypothetical protein
MAGGILGEEEKPEVESPEALAKRETFAAAVAAKLHLIWDQQVTRGALCRTV